MHRIVVDLEALARAYPPDLVSQQLADVDRVAFEMALVSATLGEKGSIVDIGGGIGMFAVACAAAGHDVTLIDDFRDPINAEYNSPLEVHKRYQVTVLDRDLVADPTLPMPDGSVDAVTTFDSIEHWHGSPRRALHEAMRILRLGGLLVIGVPNCVNLRKRMTVPFGRGKWSSFERWYDEPIYRGHVREPDVDDLGRLAVDLGLADVQVFGRNWAGLMSSRRWVTRLTPFVDRPLRRFPSLCSDLYLMGTKH